MLKHLPYADVRVVKDLSKGVRLFADRDARSVTCLYVLASDKSCN